MGPLKRRIAWRRRIEKDLRALARQQEILLKRWGDLHERLGDLHARLDDLHARLIVLEDVLGREVKEE